MGDCFLTHLARSCVDAGLPAHTPGQAAPIEQVLAAQALAVHAIGPRLIPPGHVSMPLCPVADGVVVLGISDYADALGKAAARVPVLLGWTRDEMRAFAGLQSKRPEPASEQDAANVVFVQPALDWANAAVRGGQNAFRFDWAPDVSALGACHDITSPFIFGNLEAYASAPMLQGASREKWKYFLGECGAHCWHSCAMEILQPLQRKACRTGHRTVGMMAPFA